MCPLCATTAVLTAATATATSTVIAIWGVDFCQPIIARLKAMKKWFSNRSAK